MARHSIGHGVAFQFSAAYSAIVRSLEDLSKLAMLTFGDDSGVIVPIWGKRTLALAIEGAVPYSAEMANMTNHLVAAYLTDCRARHKTGAVTPETSYYGPFICRRKSFDTISRNAIALNG